MRQHFQGFKRKPSQTRTGYEPLHEIPCFLHGDRKRLPDILAWYKHKTQNLVTNGPVILSLTSLYFAIWMLLGQGNLDN